MSTETPATNVTPAASEQVAPAAPEIHVESNFPTENSAPQTETPATTPNDDQESAEQPKRDGLNKRFSELTQQRKAAEERARIIEEQNRQLLDLLSKGKQPETAAEAKAEVAPQLENFDSYEKYLAAHARWEAKQEYAAQRKAEQAAFEKAQTEHRQRETVQRQHEAITAQKSTLEKMTAEAEKKYPDFYETVFEQSPEEVPISPVVGEAILKSKDGYELAYFLGKNPAEAQRIAKLDPVEQLVEVGTIRASLKQEKSAAPEPIKPVGQKSRASDAPSMDDDMDTWVKKRDLEEAAYKKARRLR